MEEENMRKYVILSFAAMVLAGIGVGIAQAGQNCSTTCQRTYNGGQNCQTHCY
jgi:hypothetical protein